MFCYSSAIAKIFLANSTVGHESLNFFRSVLISRQCCRGFANELAFLQRSPPLLTQSDRCWNSVVSNAKTKRNEKLFFVTFISLPKMNRQMRENQRRNWSLSASKNGEAGKILILSSTALFLFSPRALRFDARWEIDSSSQSKCGIWSVNNCHNNQKSRPSRKAPRTDKSRSVTRVNCLYEINIWLWQTLLRNDV